MRLLKANEINAKVKQINDGSALLLLYKDARVDMDILDETFSADNWQRRHDEIKGNLFCTISVWSGDHWVDKQDVGIESNAEAVKGEASDAFKRAGTNWGIGRELYTAPNIWVQFTEKELTKNGKGLKTRFHVKEIGYDDNREINLLTIADNHNKVRFSFGSKKSDHREENPTVDYATKEQCDTLRQLAADFGEKTTRGKSLIAYADDVKLTYDKAKDVIYQAEQVLDGRQK